MIFRCGKHRFIHIFPGTLSYTMHSLCGLFHNSNGEQDRLCSKRKTDSSFKKVEWSHFQSPELLGTPLRELAY